MLQEAKVAANAAVAKATDYLALLIPYITDPFQMCIVTYALHLTQHHKADYAFIRMKSMRREGLCYWTNEIIAFMN